MKGQAPPNLLASYHIEREPVARTVLNLTDRITRLATLRNPVVQSVRNFLLPVMGGTGFVGDKAAEQLSELTINYRSSSIVENTGGGRLRAGDRAPDAELRDAQGQAHRLFEIFRAPHHVLLLFLGSRAGNPAQAANLVTALDGLPSDTIDTYRIVRGEGDSGAELIDLSGNAHSAYDLMDGGVILVRPDGYVGFRDPEFDQPRLRNYLLRIFEPARGST
jgi:hypothetical protein